MTKKILLLNLKGKDLGKYTDNNLFELRSRSKLWNTPNLGLLTVGAMLNERYEIDYIDLDYDSIKDTYYDFVFMSPSTSQIPSAYILADIFQKKNAKVILGGPHVTMLPDEALNHADAIFSGESEESIKRFYDPAERIYKSHIQPELNNTPLPLYNMAAKYPYSSIPVQLSRGCPHQCKFCLSSTVYGLKIRRKSFEQAQTELSYINNIYKNPFIFFTDDNFFINENYSHQILDILKNLGLPWYAFTDISIYKKEKILSKLYSSGCRKLLIGFESLSEDNLEDINKSGFKKSRLKEYRQAIEIIQKEKIGVIGSFVVGLSHDNNDVFDKLYEFIYDSCLYGTNITIATPFPGTEFYKEVSKRQNISSDWSMYDGFTLVYDIKNIERELYMEKFTNLMNKVNSPERMNRVINYYKKIL